MRKIAALLAFIFLGACLSPVFGQGTPNPVPYLNQPVLPDSVAPGGPGFTLTVTGSGFVSGAHVNWNGSSRATTFVSVTQLTAAILAPDIAKPSTATITVTDPTPGGGTSNFQFLTITTPVSSPTFARMDESLDEPQYVGVQGVAIGDFNGDGIPDLALGLIQIADCEECSSGSQLVCVYLGVGDGTFRAPNCYNAVAEFSTYSQGNVSLATGDFNGDGKLDLVSLNADGTLSVFLGNGDGTFQPAIDSTPGGSLQAPLLVGDFNRDGKLDLVIENYTGSAPELLELLGNGDGTFSTPTTIPTGSSIYEVVSGDFNRDGNLDLAFLGSSGIYLQLGNGDGTFQAPVSISSQTGNQLLAADFNNDGNLDLLELTQQPNDISFVTSVFLGNGDGTFQSPKNSPTASGDGWYTTAVADMNGDGKLDFLMALDTTVSVQLGNGDGTFKPPVFFTVLPNFTGEYMTGDFNRDGMMDVVSLNGGRQVVDAGVVTPTSISINIQGIFPVAELSSTTMDFVDPGLGRNERDSVTLTNTGSAALTISGISISGSLRPSELTQTNNCGTSLAPNASCTINVNFLSLGGGNISASLVVADNAAGSPQTVAITAPSDDFVITSNTASTVTVNPGQSATYGITVSGLVDFQGTVALSCSSAPSGSNCTVSPGGVSVNAGTVAGSSATATVTVSTTPNTSATSKPPTYPTLTPTQFAKLVFLLIAISLLLWIARPRRYKQFAESLAMSLVLAGLIGLSACGGGGGGSSNGNGTPAGTYTITVTGKFVGGTTLTHTKQLTLVVK